MMLVALLLFSTIAQLPAKNDDVKSAPIEITSVSWDVSISRHKTPILNISCSVTNTSPSILTKVVAKILHKDAIGNVLKVTTVMVSPKVNPGQNVTFNSQTIKHPYQHQFDIAFEADTGGERRSLTYSTKLPLLQPLALRETTLTRGLPVAQQESEAQHKGHGLDKAGKAIEEGTTRASGTVAHEQTTAGQFNVGQLNNLNSEQLKQLDVNLIRQYRTMITAEIKAVRNHVDISSRALQHYGAAASNAQLAPLRTYLQQLYRRKGDLNEIVDEATKSDECRIAEENFISVAKKMDGNYLPFINHVIRDAGTYSLSWGKPTSTCTALTPTTLQRLSRPTKPGGESELPNNYPRTTD